MSFRIPSIEVSEDEPFKYDNLERAATVNFVANIVGNTADQPLVLAIDSPYGTGKSTFVDMLDKVLTQKNYQTVYFNAWKADHVTDPLIAMVAALDEAMPKSTADSAGMSEKMARVRKISGILLKRAAVVGVKIATAGVVDLPDDIEEALADSASDATSDIIESFEKETEAAKCFRAELEKAIAALPEANKKPTLVYFIDELDRCRPDFAISLLERVKHMFDVPNIAFVLSVDKRQLEAVTAAVYGDKIDAAEYLRKFIDLEFGLPSPSKNNFIRNAINRAGLSERFASLPTLERDQLLRFLSMFAHLYDLSLRAIERCIVRLKLVLTVMPDRQTVHTVQVAMLVVLRSADKDMFDRVVKRNVGAEEAMQYFKSRPGGYREIDEIDEMVLETMLVAELSSEGHRKIYRENLLHILNSPGADAETRSKVGQKIGILDSFANQFSRGRRLERIAATIDFAAYVRD